MCLFICKQYHEYKVPRIRITWTLLNDNQLIFSSTSEHRTISAQMPFLSAFVTTVSENRIFGVLFLLNLDKPSSSRKLWFLAFNRPNWTCSDSISSSSEAAGYLCAPSVCNFIFSLKTAAGVKGLCIELIRNPYDLSLLWTALFSLGLSSPLSYTAI